MFEDSKYATVIEKLILNMCDRLVAQFDGASAGNPGQAGAGFVVFAQINNNFSAAAAMQSDRVR